ncbi:hypothetical protein CPB86DRAFT_835863 [Serendipita vermifera]|nr:hypothetical protein CPB86DRAFT_835863 [Serendipita vermifera]
MEISQYPTSTFPGALFFDNKVHDSTFTNVVCRLDQYGRSSSHRGSSFSPMSIRSRCSQEDSTIPTGPHYFDNSGLLKYAPSTESSSHIAKEYPDSISKPTGTEYTPSSSQSSAMYPVCFGFFNGKNDPLRLDSDPWHQSGLEVESGLPVSILEFKSLGTSQTRHKQMRACPVQRKAKDGALLDAAFTTGSVYESDTLRGLLDLVLISEVLEQDEEEPCLGSREGNAILENMKVLGYELPSRETTSRQSMYTFFLGEDRNQCLICGKSKTCLQRGIECVRSHLNHRPFVCGGGTMGCKSCVRQSE